METTCSSFNSKTLMALKNNPEIPPFQFVFPRLHVLAAHLSFCEVRRLAPIEQGFSDTRSAAFDLGSATVPVAPFGVPPNGRQTGAVGEL
jgi:hypothetical protein